MAADGGVERRWSDLHADLLSEVYLKSTSACDRARFGAVCSTWRGVALWHRPLPALPLLLTSTGHGNGDNWGERAAYSLEDRRALSVPLPLYPGSNRFLGSYEGGWIATKRGYEKLHIMNFSSGAPNALRTYGGPTVEKIVFSDDPSSGGCVLAALTTEREVAFRRVGSPVLWWKTSGRGLRDITFCNGELYGFTHKGLLFKFDVGVSKAGTLEDISFNRVDAAPMHTLGVSSADVKYIFELRGKPAIAVEVGYCCKRGHSFRVFKLVDNGDDATTTSHKYTWAEVTSLGDHALFLGPACCKAVHVSTTGRRGGVDANCIYYLQEHSCLHSNVKCFTNSDIESCTVYCEGEGVHPLASRGYYYRKHPFRGIGNSCMWIWPPTS